MTFCFTSTLEIALLFAQIQSQFPVPCFISYSLFCYLSFSDCCKHHWPRFHYHNSSAGASFNHSFCYDRCLHHCNSVSSYSQVCNLGSVCNLLVNYFDFQILLLITYYLLCL
ncbi:hypothetical protein Patl1_03778 [Pistacia atlantica]|uniref:Uncharacterized protein n=1 Tax=Pistacia atlantica TaxID=434234 RepID=A0ACC1BVC9_9ROSI|nr:hypothetical protein Patl1_03778 [Pistacia atlantica]